MKLQISKSNIGIFLLGLICVVLMSPYAARTVGDAGFTALTLLYLLVEITPLVNTKKAERMTFLMIAVYILVLVANKVLGRSTASVAYHYNIVKFYVAFVCIAPIYGRLRKKQAGFLLAVILLTLAVTMLQNFQLKMRLGSRYSIQLYNTSGVKAIISTQYTCAILLMSGCMFSLFLYLRRSLWRPALLLGVVFCFAFNLVVTQRGIILLLSILMYPLLWLCSGKNRSAKRYLAFVGFVAAALVFYIAYEPILTWIGEITGSQRLVSRMNSIVTLIQAGGIEEAGGGSLTARLRGMEISIQTFSGSVSNFLFGVGMKTDSNTLVGNHSQFFDEFAKFGVFVAVFNILTVFRMLKISRKMSGVNKEDRLYPSFSVLFFVFLLRALVGGVLEPSVGAVVFIAMPLMFKLANERKMKV